MIWYDLKRHEENIRIHSPFNIIIQLMRFQNEIGIKTKEAIEKRYGTKYTVGSIAEAICKQIFSHFLFYFIEMQTERKKFLSKLFIQIDLASGGSIDWVYTTQNVSLTYSFEFRDKRHGNFAS